MENNQKSELRNNLKKHNKTGDSHTFFCFPQAHAQVFETLDLVEEILTSEINAATDNPLVFTNEDDPELSKGYAILSGGNFHGEYIAKAADYLGMSIHDLAMMSEVNFINE